MYVEKITQKNNQLFLSIDRVAINGDIRHVGNFHILDELTIASIVKSNAKELKIRIRR